MKARYTMLAVLFPVLAGCSGCAEPCLKKYTMSGTVADNSSSPIQDVQVIWPAGSSDVRTTTDSAGKYSIYFETRTIFESGQLEFAKSGFQTVKAPAFTADEAGEDRCDGVSLVRNATLAP